MLYATDAPLGARLQADGSVAVSLWAPTARSVALHLFDGPQGPATERLPMQVATVELDVQSSDPSQHAISVVWCLLIEDPGRFRKGAIRAIRLNPRQEERAA